VHVPEGRLVRPNAADNIRRLSQPRRPVVRAGQRPLSSGAQLDAPLVAGAAATAHVRRRQDPRVVHDHPAALQVPSPKEEQPPSPHWSQRVAGSAQGQRRLRLEAGGLPARNPGTRGSLRVCARTGQEAERMHVAMVVVTAL